MLHFSCICCLFLFVFAAVPEFSFALFGAEAAGTQQLRCFQLLRRKSIGATSQVAGTVQDENCIIVADLSNR